MPRIPSTALTSRVARAATLWVPKTCATWADALGIARFGQAARRRPGRSWPGRRWDALRLMGLKLIFLVVSRAMSLLRLSRRESWWKDAEILMLRHQLAVAERERPKARARLTWPDRAWLALLAGTAPTVSLAGMRLLVTPGTILRWHRDIVRRRWGRLSRRGRSGRPASRRRPGPSACAVQAAPAWRTRPGRPAHTAPGRRAAAIPRSHAGAPAAQHPSPGRRRTPGRPGRVPDR